MPHQNRTRASNKRNVEWKRNESRGLLSKRTTRESNASTKSMLQKLLLLLIFVNSSDRDESKKKWRKTGIAPGNVSEEIRVFIDHVEKCQFFFEISNKSMNLPKNCTHLQLIYLNRRRLWRSIEFFFIDNFFFIGLVTDFFSIPLVVCWHRHDFQCWRCKPQFQKSLTKHCSIRMNWPEIRRIGNCNAKTVSFRLVSIFNWTCLPIALLILKCKKNIYRAAQIELMPKTSSNAFKRIRKGKYGHGHNTELNQLVPSKKKTITPYRHKFACWWCTAVDLFSLS